MANRHNSTGGQPRNSSASVSARIQVIPRCPSADLSTENKMAMSKDSFPEEVANISDHGKSPESLAKTKDGSTFAAKARAAELNATRARRAAAKHGHISTEGDADDDIPPLAPVPLGSLKFTRSRSRGSKAWKPPNNLTELPEVTAENKVKTPSPQHHSPQLLQRAPNSPLNPEQSISRLDQPRLPVTPSSGGGKASVSTATPFAADWRNEVIFSPSPHRSHQSFHHALVETQPTLRQSTHDLNPIHVHTPLSTRIDGTFTSTTKKCVVDWALDPTTATTPRRSLPQASPTINNLQQQGSPLRAYDPNRATFNLNPADLWDPDMPPLYDVFGAATNQYTAQDVRYGGSPIIPEKIFSSPYHGRVASGQLPQPGLGSSPIASGLTQGAPATMDPPNAKSILNKLGKMTYNELMALSDKDKLLINTAQYALGQPPTDWDSFSPYQKMGEDTAKTTTTHTSTRDPNAYTNPMHMAPVFHQKSIVSDLPRTVAHDPLARPLTTDTTATTMRSTLKPEAAIYTPKFVEEKLPQSYISAAGNRLGTEAAGNIAMATFIKQRRRQTLEEAVQSLRTNPMDREFAAVKKQIEDRTNAMTASLAGDSIPDNELSRHSVATRQPKPIGYGRPNIKQASPTTRSMSNSRHETLDNRVGSDIIANTIANLKLHENPTIGDYSTRYRNAHACEVHQGPDGNKSLFDPEWGTPPSRVARDPRRIRQLTMADGRQHVYHEDPMRLRGVGSASGSASGNRR